MLFSPKILFLSLVLLSIEKANSLEFKTGDYELINGDEKVCPEGQLQQKGDQLIFGGKLVFADYKKSSVEFLNDEKDCKYHIQNNHTAKNYEQITTILCKKDKAVNTVIRFHYETPVKLMMEISSNGKKHRCELLWKK